MTVPTRIPDDAEIVFKDSPNVSGNVDRWDRETTLILVCLLLCMFIYVHLTVW